ncbi:MAG: MBL fold metallo-hydrolase, partial [Acidimicrobiia bacterium]|nr:MBL fold metallo-hydrolase [Acidimicrobiia bacterium]MDX2466595.1 MBL fold metallo-hydrolase [Acidimicrobiia bacterium]
MTTCVAIVDDGRAWLLDAGPDFRQHLAELNKADIELEGILLTHGHIGHYTGLMFLGREAMNTQSLPVWAAPRLAEFISSNGPWRQLVDGGNIDLRVLEPNVDLALTHQVSAMGFPVPHRDEYSETVGFSVTGPNHRVVYVPDTDSWDGWDTPIESY